MITDLKINEEQKRKYYEAGWWTPDSIREVWHTQVARFGEREYVCDDTGSRFTYHEVDDAAGRLAAWLASEGVCVGDVVTVQFPTWAEFCIAYVAVMKLGAVMHPVPRNYNDMDLEYAMNLVGSRAFLCPTFSHNVDYEAQIASVRENIPTLGPIAVLDKQAPSHTDAPTFADILARFTPLSSFEPVSADSVACILPTSGTTGKPKQAMLTHNNILFSERVFTRELGRTEEDAIFMPSPLNHATGFFHGLISPMLLGGRAVLQQDFRAREAIELMNAEGVTWSMSATPFIFDMLNVLEASGDELAFQSLNLFCCGGAPLPPSLIERAHRHGVLLCEIYGSTESCPHVYVPPARCLEWDGAWSGVPFEGIEVRVIDGAGHEVPHGEQGEEISRGPHMFVGYLNEPERTDRALDDDGWFYSGDLCYQDDEGRIRINGRKKEVIIRGGENISAREIDDDLIGCPGLANSATIGMPDERLGERICTFIVPSDPARVPTQDDLIAYLKERHVAKRLWPERVETIDEIPVTATGKVKRFILSQVLKERMEAE
ncbi:medium-chain fatty-acid--CoA ligase [Eggerthellaceae bacterium 24-137]